MPTVAQSLTTNAARTRVTATIPVDNVRMKSVSVVNLTNGSSPAFCYVEIGIMSGGTNQENRVTVLTSGYVGEFNPVAWFGDLLGDAAHFVYVNAFSSVAYNLRLTVISEVT